MADFQSIKRAVIFLALIFIIIIILGLAAGVISFLTSPPSFASYHDNVTLDIGEDGYLIAKIDKALAYDSKSIENGEVNSSEGMIEWKNARNVSFVDTSGKRCYAIVWKEPLKDTSLEVDDLASEAHLYGNIHNQKGMFAVYYLQYNPENQYVYGIILDNNGNNYDLNDLLYDILNLSKSKVNYHDYSYGGYSSPRYGGVDTSPSRVAYSDPDWYYDYYDYGDYDYLDEYLESQGY